MMLQADKCRLRAVEPADVDSMYIWENDPDVWRVSGTTEPFSRERLQRFVEEQRFDIYATRQLRLIIEAPDGRSVGALDIFRLRPADASFRHRHTHIRPLRPPAGLRGIGLEAVKRYGRDTLGVHQIWCSASEDNRASLALFGKAGFEICGRAATGSLRQRAIATIS